MKYGKLPVRHDARTLAFERYTSRLPNPPRSVSPLDRFQHFGWGTLGNDQYGDCVWAGAAHETMLWTTEAGKLARFDDVHVLADYAKVTGFDPRTGANDNGTVVLDALNYRRKVGVHDASGTAHKIGAYAKVDASNTVHLKAAVWLFDAVGIGFEVPDYAEDQFALGQIWHIGGQDPNAPIVGGHYVPVVGYDSGGLWLVTWGELHRMTWQFFRKYTDEAYALLSPDMLRAGKSPDGFDLATLNADLAAL